MEPFPFKGLDQGKHIQVAGRRIWVTVVGEGPALLLLHGGGPGATGASNFTRNIPVLARQSRLILPDLPGYGQSTKGIDRVDPFGDLAGAMLGLLDALGIDKVHTLGNSLGGTCALRLALERPERVGRLVLLGPGAASTRPNTLPPTV